MSDYLADRQAITDVMATYAACVDDRDDEGYRALFTDDVEVLGMGPEPIKGLDDWFAYWQEAVNKYSATQHLLGPTLADLDGDYARTRTDVQAHHYVKDAPEKTVTLWATYRTDMRRQGKGWKICRHQLLVRGLHRS